MFYFWMLLRCYIKKIVALYSKSSGMLYSLNYKIASTRQVPKLKCFRLVAFASIHFCECWYFDKYVINVNINGPIKQCKKKQL